MKNEKKLVLELNELPLRAEKLDPEKIQAVFGGCVEDGGLCVSYKDCCDISHRYIFCNVHLLVGTCGSYPL